MPRWNIPNEIIVDLENTEINSSLKISSVKLPENVLPTITDRDFVIATVAAPTIVKEPEKPAEGEGETTEGEEATSAESAEKPAEGAAEKTEGSDKAKEEDKSAAGKK